MKPRYQTVFTIGTAGIMLAVMGWIYLERRQASAAAEEISALEGRALAAWRDILDDAGETWEPADAARIESEVLPPWREARRRLKTANSGSLASHFPPEVTEFFRLREESWLALIAAVREGDPEQFDRYEAKFAAAERIGHGIMDSQGPPVVE